MRPNILFFLPDQHRPDWLGGRPDLPLRTPNLDRLAAGGVRFSNAFTPSPLCAPARACLAAGLDYPRCRVPGNGHDFPLDQPTYYQRLRDAGYRVCGVGKFDLHKATRDWGRDGSRRLAEWGFTEGIDNEGKLDGSGSFRAAGEPRGPYLDHLLSRGLASVYAREHAGRREHRDAYVTALPGDAYCDNWLAENGLRFLRRFPENRPWHLVVNFTGPHNPMDVTGPMARAWSGTVFPGPVAGGQGDYTPEDHQRNRRHYAAMIENIDRLAGLFLDLARARGEMERTLVVYAADHGEMLGDHGLWGKSTWHTASAGIPMIIAGPGVARGVTVKQPVSLHDLAATFLDCAGAAPLPGADARSLKPLLEGAPSRRAVVFSALGNWRLAFDGRYKLVERAGGETLLYDTRCDPHELDPRRLDPGGRRPRGPAAQLERALSAWAGAPGGVTG